MKTIIFIIALCLSMSAFAAEQYTTHYSDGSFSNTTIKGNEIHTYNSDGSFSNSTIDNNQISTFNSDGSFSQTDF